MMPLVIDEQNASRMGSFELTQRERFFVPTKQFKRSFYVLGDTLEDDEATIVLTTGIPQLGSIHLGAVCLSLKAKERSRVIHPLSGAACGLWEVTGDFDSDVDSSQIQQGDPTSWTPEWEWDSEEEEEVLEKDAVTGKPITTSAGEPILVTHPITIPTLLITRYELWPFNPQIKLVYENRINSAEFWGAPIGTVRLSRIRAGAETIDDGNGPQRYAKAEYLFKFKMRDDPDNPGSLLSNTWKSQVLDQGHFYLDYDGKMVRALDERENPRLVNLDGEGGELGEGLPAKYVTYNRLTQINFNNLNLGPFA